MSIEELASTLKTTPECIQELQKTNACSCNIKLIEEIYFQLIQLYCKTNFNKK